MIIVVNKRTHKPTDLDVYIGRPSPLGNPYPVSMGRELCIQRYREEFNLLTSTKKNTKNFYWPECRKELAKIYQMSKIGTVYLVCWCKPLSCHGDVIKEFIDSFR